MWPEVDDLHRTLWGSAGPPHKLRRQFRRQLTIILDNHQLEPDIINLLFLHPTSRSLTSNLIDIYKTTKLATHHGLLNRIHRVFSIGAAKRSLFTRPKQLARRNLNLNMAWRCSGSTNESLIENMWKNGLITDPRVKEAFLKVRPHHIPRSQSSDDDVNGYHYRSTAPTMHPPHPTKTPPSPSATQPPSPRHTCTPPPSNTCSPTCSPRRPHRLHGSST